LDLQQCAKLQYVPLGEDMVMKIEGGNFQGGNIEG
jgi:hypothetical protein